jgi:predicted acylesterase/phospholipase RssA
MQRPPLGVYRESPMDDDSSKFGDTLPRPLGLVLGGGGSLGAVQVGMLEALSELRVTPDLVIGTSVGSLNGAVIALNPQGAANRLSHAWARITRDQIFPGGLLPRRGPYNDLRRTSSPIPVSPP